MGGIFLVSLATAYAGQVTLTWDASPGPDLKGYNLYYGLTSGKTSGQYTSKLDVGLGNKTKAEAACTVATNGTVTCNKLNLNDSGVYYFRSRLITVRGPKASFRMRSAKRGSSIAPPVANFNANPPRGPRP